MSDDGWRDLPRLPPEYYQGDAVVLWTLPVFDRGKGWLNQSFHLAFQNLMLHVAAREQLFCPVYCLMPDHIHLIWMGLTRDSDQRNGMAFLRTYLESLLTPHKFQPQAHDHVLREKERKRNAFALTCDYLLNNPVRAGFVTNPSGWEFIGAVIPGYPKMEPAEPEFWPKFWKIYLGKRAPDAGDIMRPAIGGANL
jgi:putative transposase